VTIDSMLPNVLPYNGRVKSIIALTDKRRAKEIPSRKGKQLTTDPLKRRLRILLPTSFRRQTQS